MIQEFFELVFENSSTNDEIFVRIIDFKNSCYKNDENL